MTNILCIPTKTERTRTRLQQVAVDLFAERGFDRVTVAEIAEAAGVTPMTFYRHFPTKEQVLLDDPYDPLIAEVVAAQDPGRPGLDRVVGGLRQAWSAISAIEDEPLRRRVRVGAAVPRVRGQIAANNARTEQAIVDALVATGTPRFDAVVAAAAALGALTAALLEWASSAEDPGPGAQILAALDLLVPREAVR